MEARERYKSFLKIWALEVGCQKQKKEAVRLNEAYHQVKPSVLLQKAEMPSQILSGVKSASSVRESSISK